ESSDGAWVPEAFTARNSTAPSDTSWIWGIPGGIEINPGPSVRGAWWTGKNTDPEVTYFSNENSVINGPCFNLSELSRPMISLDYISDADINDGAVLQFSIDGGNNWTTVGNNLGGNKAPGINWF